MTKKILIETTVFLAMLILDLTIQSDPVAANPIGYYFPKDPHTIINVQYPGNLSDVTVRALQVRFSLNMSLWYPGYLSDYNPSYSCNVTALQCFLDGKNVGNYNGSEVTNSSIALSGLFDGQHKLEINITTIGMYLHEFEGAYSLYEEPVVDTSGPIYFTVKYCPNISNLSIENKTYNTNTIPLNFETDTPIRQASYNLDGQANVTISGNTTLAGLTDGSHSIIVYAEDSARREGKSDIVFFTVTENIWSQLDPTVWDLMLLVAFAVFIALAAVLFRKHRNKPRNQ